MRTDSGLLMEKIKKRWMLMLGMVATAQVLFYSLKAAHNFSLDAQTCSHFSVALTLSWENGVRHLGGVTAVPVKCNRLPLQPAYASEAPVNTRRRADSSGHIEPCTHFYLKGTLLGEAILNAGLNMALRLDSTVLWWVLTELSGSLEV